MSSLAISVIGAVDQYPAYMWAQKAKGKKIEYKPEVGPNGEIVSVFSTKVSEEVKNILETTNINSFIVYNRPGMTTKGLVDTLVNNNQIATLLRESKNNAVERSFVDITGEPVSQELTKKFENVRTIVVDSKESLEELKKEFESTPKPFIHQYYIIDVAVSDAEAFDEIVFQIERAFEQRTLGNHLSILTGSPLAHRQLKEVSIPQNLRLMQEASDTPDQMVFSGTLTKALIAIPIVFLMIISVGLLMDIKTPTLFVSESIDFGKIEK